MKKTHEIRRMRQRLGSGFMEHFTLIELLVVICDHRDSGGDAAAGAEPGKGNGKNHSYVPLNFRIWEKPSSCI